MTFTINGLSNILRVMLAMILHQATTGYKALMAFLYLDRIKEANEDTLLAYLLGPRRKIPLYLVTKFTRFRRVIYGAEIRLYMGNKKGSIGGLEQLEIKLIHWYLSSGGSINIERHFRNATEKPPEDKPYDRLWYFDHLWYDNLKYSDLDKDHYKSTDELKFNVITRDRPNSVILKPTPCNSFTPCGWTTPWDEDGLVVQIHDNKIFLEPSFWNIGNIFESV